MGAGGGQRSGRRAAVSQTVAGVAGGLDALSRMPDERPVVAGHVLVRLDVHADRSQTDRGVIVRPRPETEHRKPRVGAELVTRRH